MWQICLKMHEFQVERIAFGELEDDFCAISSSAAAADGDDEGGGATTCTGRIILR
jgi:hypothetical protein